MEMKRKGIERGSLLSLDTEVHTAQLVRLEDFGLRLPHDSYALSGSAILLQATEHLLCISRRDKGFLHQIGVISTESTGMQTAVVYFRADAELHVLAMTNAEDEVVDFLSDAQRSGALNCLWVTPSGDLRLSPVPFDRCLAMMLRSARRAAASDVLTSMYDAIESVHYALRPHVLHEQGIDPSAVRRSVVHYLATPTMLDRAGELGNPSSVTKH